MMDEWKMLARHVAVSDAHGERYLLRPELFVLTTKLSPASLPCQQPLIRGQAVKFFQRHRYPKWWFIIFNDSRTLD
jgi:hypothetical protein